MNCLDYRRTLLAGEPEDDSMRVHREGCVRCGALLREHCDFESGLRAAFEVPVPAGLEHRLVAAVRNADAPVPASSRRRFLAAAAVVVGSSGLAAYYWLRRDDPLALACVRFVMNEEANAIAAGPMPRAEAARALAGTLPLERIERLGDIRRVGPCPFNGATAYHVLLTVGGVKVTLLVMPGARVAARGEARDAGLHAAVLPLRGGAVGIVTPSAATLAGVADALREAGAGSA